MTDFEAAEKYATHEGNVSRDGKFVLETVTDNRELKAYLAGRKAPSVLALVEALKYYSEFLPIGTNDSGVQARKALKAYEKETE